VPQHEIEVILTRELAGYLAMAVFVVDPAGSLIFYNEPAEALLGTRFEETGPMEMDDWAHVFDPRDEDGNPLCWDRNTGAPVHSWFTQRLQRRTTSTNRGTAGRTELIAVRSIRQTGHAEAT